MSRHLLEHDIVTIPLSRCSLRPLEYDALLLGFTGWSAGETTSTVERLARIVEPPSSTPRARRQEVLFSLAARRYVGPSGVELNLFPATRPPRRFDEQQ